MPLPQNRQQVIEGDSPDLHALLCMEASAAGSPHPEQPSRPSPWQHSKLISQVSGSLPPKRNVYAALAAALAAWNEADHGLTTKNALAKDSTSLRLPKPGFHGFRPRGEP